MPRIPYLMVGAACFATLAVAGAASSAPGKTGATAAIRSSVAIVNRVSEKQASDLTFRGTLILFKDGVKIDSGSSIIIPHIGDEKTVGGQRQTPVLLSTNNLTTKKGTLNLAFTGVAVTVQNINPAKALAPFEIEYGIWRIRGGTGAYKGWRGGGRWANVSVPGTNNIEWDGYVTG